MTKKTRPPLRLVAGATYETETGRRAFVERALPERLGARFRWKGYVVDRDGEDERAAWDDAGQASVPGRRLVRRLDDADMPFARLLEPCLPGDPYLPLAESECA